MKKKGVEMSMNVIIIAAIGLLILLILAFLVITHIGNTEKGLKSCSVQFGGICSSDCSSDNVLTTEETDCTDGKQCCRVIG